MQRGTPGLGKIGTGMARKLFAGAASGSGNLRLTTEGGVGEPTARPWGSPDNDPIRRTGTAKGDAGTFPPSKFYLFLPIRPGGRWWRPGHLTTGAGRGWDLRWLHFVRLYRARLR